MLVGNGKFLAALSAAGSQNAASVLCGHSLAETVLVHSFPVVRLECSFHRSCYLCFYSYILWAAKVLIFFVTAKEQAFFSPMFYAFFGKISTFAAKTSRL